MVRIEVNRETCNGYGNCVVAASSIFDIDDEGLVVLLQATAEDDDVKAARQAAYDCPTDSIKLTDADPPGAPG
jgi:ferredoxin